MANHTLHQEPDVLSNGYICGMCIDNISIVSYSAFTMVAERDTRLTDACITVSNSITTVSDLNATVSDSNTTVNDSSTAESDSIPEP